MLPSTSVGSHVESKSPAEPAAHAGRKQEEVTSDVSRAREAVGNMGKSSVATRWTVRA